MAVFLLSQCVSARRCFSSRIDVELILLCLVEHILIGVLAAACLALSNGGVYVVVAVLMLAYLIGYVLLIDVHVVLDETKVVCATVALLGQQLSLSSLLLRLQAQVVLDLCQLLALHRREKTNG